MAPLNISRFTSRRLGRSPRVLCPTLPLQNRLIHQTSLQLLPRKDSQDKDSINTEATEYTKSGTDDEVAAQDKAAFDPNQTSPEAQKATAGEGNSESGNPLDVSPANTDVSKQNPNTGAENSGGKKKQSGAGSPNKGKKI